MNDGTLDVDDVLEPVPSWSIQVRRGLAKRCARCGARGTFNTWFRQKERCPACGFAFEREPGHFTGVYLINFCATEAALFVVLMGFVFWMANDPEASVIPPLVAGGLLAIVAPLAGYPYARTTWSAIDLAMRPLELSEIVAAADHVNGVSDVADDAAVADEADEASTDDGGV